MSIDYELSPYEDSSVLSVTTGYAPLCCLALIQITDYSLSSCNSYSSCHQSLQQHMHERIIYPYKAF